MTVLNALEHKRTRYPNLVNPSIVIVDALRWQTDWDNTDGEYSVDTSKTGEEVFISWGDGTRGRGDDVHSYADDSIKKIKITSSDGFSGLLMIASDFKKGIGTLPVPNGCSSLVEYSFPGNSFTGSIPSFSAVNTLETLRLNDGNQLTGVIPSFSACTALKLIDLRGNLLSGTIPSFSACTALGKFYVEDNNLTGDLPSFNDCTVLKEFLCGDNSFSGAFPTFAACTILELCHGQNSGFTSYTSGCFATQKSLSQIKLHTNSWDQTNVDACLADLVTSLGGGRVTCTVELNGAGMAAPSSLTAHNTLEAAGWTVDVN